jgi:hypothetical protein
MKLNTPLTISAIALILLIALMSFNAPSKIQVVLACNSTTEVVRISNTFICKGYYVKEIIPESVSISSGIARGGFILILEK